MKTVYFSLLILTFSPLYAEREGINKHSNDAIMVIGHQHDSNLLDFVPSVTELSGEKLLMRQEVSLGDTLQKETGVASTGYGPNASRPVIRGLDGNRIILLQNGLGTIDASAQSVDHAVPIDMLTIDQIEVVRGPMSLLYGASAVGGVVNVVTDRVHQDFDPGFYGKINLQAQDAQPGSTQSMTLNYGVSNWMFHFDGTLRNLGELQTPGFARTASTRASEVRVGETEGETVNSFNKQQNIGFGVSKILSDGYLGISYFNTDNRYGTVSETDVSIDMTQNRFELHYAKRLDQAFLGFISEIRVKSAQSNYKHIEFEGKNVGTTFTNEGNETRIELLNKSENFQGISGIQTKFNDFSAFGDEAYLPGTESQDFALFTLQDYKYGSQKLSIGARAEFNKIEKLASTNFGAANEKDFNGMSLSLGHQKKFSTTVSLNHSISYSQRAPSAQELYSNGAHIATSTFERGNANLKREKALALESSLKWDTQKTQGRLSLFLQNFDGYISLDPAGTVDSNSSLAIYDYNQGGANIYGFEAEGDVDLMRLKGGVLKLNNTWDYIRGRATGSRGDLTRMTPMRIGSELEYSTNKWLASLGGRYTFKQEKIAKSETRTGGYFLLDANFHYDIVVKNAALTLYAKANNIFDKEARNHISFLKNISPLAGRNFVLGIRGSF